MLEFTIIDRALKMSHTMHSARSIFKLISNICRWVYPEPSQRSKIGRFEKIIIAFNYFCKTLHLKSLRGF